MTGGGSEENWWQAAAWQLRCKRCITQLEAAVEIAIANRSDGSRFASSLGFIGGSPLLPKGFILPCSALTGAPMAFMFQIFFPLCHALAGKTLALFFAIDDAHEDLLVPPLSCGELSRMNVTENELAAQQILHTAFLFEVVEVERAVHVSSPVEHRLLVEATGAVDETEFGSVENYPRWILEDETPGNLNGKFRPAFCFQTVERLALPRRSGAPGQVVFDIFGGKSAGEEPDYEMFAGNAAYYFSYPNQQMVAVVVQGD